MVLEYDMLEVNHMQLRGIDVSSHQGVINWEQVKSQVDFAIIRCGFGVNKPEYDDKQFIYNANECTRLGIPFGVYLYSYASNIENAKSEAEHTLRLIQNYKLEYPVFYDVEDPQYQAGLSNDILTQICTTYCDAMEQAGYYVGIYSSLSWFRTKLNSKELNRFDKWVAQWNQVDQADFIHGMWQYTSDGRVAGINGRVDMDIAYYDYPAVIKRAGLNGFPKPDPDPKPDPEPDPTPDPEKTCEEKLEGVTSENDALKKENEALQEKIKELEAGTIPEEAKLIFTCPKTATYYIMLSKGDQLYYKEASVDNENAS